MSALTIGKLAKAADVKIPTIRFYEQIGLLPEPARTESERRTYEAPAVRRLAFIKHARQLGFPIEAIRTLLDLSDNPERACDDANTIAQEQLTAVETKIAQLEALRGELRRMVAAGCHGLAGDCRVIETLADGTNRVDAHAPEVRSIRPPDGLPRSRINSPHNSGMCPKVAAYPLETDQQHGGNARACLLDSGRSSVAGSSPLTVVALPEKKP